MGSRLELHAVLVAELGSANVYFQPPSGHQIQYPCIIYHRNDIDTDFADNLPYTLTKQYSVTVVDADPDSDIPDKIAALPACTFNRAFKSNQLNHDVFTIFY